MGRDGEEKKNKKKKLSGLIVLTKERKEESNVWRAKSDPTNVTSVFPKGF